jgi:hypothetical protein
MEQPKNTLEQLDEKPKWGELREDNFGYASDQERLAKRGMEDWELVEKIPESQNKVPYWFMAVVVSVLLVGVGLSFPFWGLRPGVEVRWTEWVLEPGFLGSLVYIAVAATFVYYMVNLYGTSAGEGLDSDKEKQNEESTRNN